MKNNFTRAIFFILMICTMITIFMFSNQNGEESSSFSREVVAKIIEILPFTNGLEIQQKENIIENSQLVIRKLAHFSIYAFLGFNIIGFINTFEKLKRKNIIYITIAIGVLYAVSDEIHQMFSDGRSAKVTDILIDTLGVMFGIFSFYKITKNI